MQASSCIHPLASVIRGMVSCRSSNGCFINLHQSSSMGSKAIEPARHLSTVDVGKTRRLSVLAVRSTLAVLIHMKRFQTSPDGGPSLVNPCTSKISPRGCIALQVTGKCTCIQEARRDTFPACSNGTCPAHLHVRCIAGSLSFVSGRGGPADLGWCAIRKARQNLQLLLVLGRGSV